MLICRGIDGVDDCVVYESAAIVAFLDDAFPCTPRLLPLERGARLEARLWQYWELCIAEEFWPLSRMQVDGVLWRWGYSPAEFEEARRRSLTPHSTRPRAPCLRACAAGR